MCGLAAVLSVRGERVDRAVVEHMTEIIAHRGPDDSGSYFWGPVGFGFRRLSVLDLTPAAHQPMTTPDGQATLVFNGEIYNYRELRQELQGLGHSFKSSGDTEVLLHAYCQWGPDCLTRLNGMWAFIIHDRRRAILFGSRDRFGIKPLYRYRGRDHVMFASEIKAIRASDLYLGGTNWPIAAGFLLQDRLDRTKETFYEGIEQVLPGTWFELDMAGRYQERRYWSVLGLPQQDVKDPAAEFAELFEDSMRLHMRSDVPVAVHLSGGMDSTSIICAAARLREAGNAEQPPLAFSYIAGEFDETRFIDDTIRQTHARLIKLEADPIRLWSNLEEVLWFQDEPFHSIYLLVAYELMRLTASNGIKVILNGQGADETLAGYPSYSRDYWNGLLMQGRIGEAWNEMGEYTKVHGGRRKRLLARQLRHLLQSELHRLPAYRHMSDRMHHRRTRDNAWFSDELPRAAPTEDIGFLGSDLNAALERSILRDSLPLYLRVEDRNSMAHSIEARVPFLDHRLVSLSFALPANWRMRGPWNKYVLREAMRNRIPESVRTRAAKFGFPVPAKKWFLDLLYEPTRDLLGSRQARERGIYNVGEILKDLERHRLGEVDISSKLFSVLQFEVWSQMIEARPRKRAFSDSIRKPLATTAA